MKRSEELEKKLLEIAEVEAKAQWRQFLEEFFGEAAKSAETRATASAESVREAMAWMLVASPETQINIDEESALNNAVQQLAQRLFSSQVYFVGIEWAHFPILIDMEALLSVDFSAMPLDNLDVVIADVKLQEFVRLEWTPKGYEDHTMISLYRRPI